MWKVASGSPFGKHTSAFTRSSYPGLVLESRFGSRPPLLRWVVWRSCILFRRLDASDPSMFPRGVDIIECIAEDDPPVGPGGSFSIIRV